MEVAKAKSMLKRTFPRPGARIFKTALAVTAAVWVTSVILGQQFTASAGIAAVLSMQPTWEETRSITWVQIATSIAGAVWGGAAGLVFVNNPIWVGLNVFLLFVLGKWTQQERVAALSVTVMLLTMVHSDQLWHAAYRVVATFFGIATGLCVNFLIWRPTIGGTVTDKNNSAAV